MLSALGEILLARYRSQFATVYTDRHAQHELKEAPVEMRRVIAEKFCDPKQRGQKTEMKNGHYVYDDGNNCYRIYYLSNSQGFPVIYKLFWTDHEAHERYCQQRKPPRNNFDVHVFRIAKGSWQLVKVSRP